jgi:hypothetical protein
MTTTVRLLPLGPVYERVNIRAIADNLNSTQRLYQFTVDDPLLNLPQPTVYTPALGNVSPQFDAAELFEYILRHRGMHLSSNVIIVGIIDTEVYDELFSTIDRANTMILVSTRINNLPVVLAQSRKTYEQYVALEIGAQLLAIEYRRRAGIFADPKTCAKPWHIERRNCLFDYYGLDPANVQKLISPKISDQVLAEMRAAEVPQRAIDASLAIVKKAATTMWLEVFRRAPSDPIVALGIGAVIGLSASIVANLDAARWAAFTAVAMLVIFGRMVRLKRK